MTNEQLLEKAKKDYPIGTKFKIAHMSDTISYVKDANYYWGKNNNIYCGSKKNANDHETYGYNGCVYFNGKWAEIIEKPEVKDEFIVDKWYKVKWSNQIQKMYIKPTDFPDKKHVNCKGPNSIWLNSGIPYINKESTYVVSDLSEIELLTDLSEIQQYLPDGHVDKIVTPKFEVGKWYKCSCNSNLYQFDGFITDKKWGSSAEINPRDREHGNAKPGYTKTTSHDACIEYFSPTSLADMEIVNKFLPKVEEKWIPKVGDYVVTKNYAREYDGRVLQITKISEGDFFYFIVFDNGEYSKNSNFGKQHKVRKATQEEIDSVTKTKEKVYNYEVVHCTTQEEWNFVKKITGNPESKSTFNIYKKDSCILLNFSEERGHYSNIDFFKRGNSKIYTFKEWCNKFNHKPDFEKSVPEYEALPMPPGAVKIIAKFDIIKYNYDHYSCVGNTPDIIPKGSISWCNQWYSEKIKNQDSVICIEDNRWFANIKAVCFEIHPDYLEKPKQPKEKVSFKVGDTVRVVDQSYSWGAVKKGDIGTIRIIWVDDDIRVDFPAQSNWNCKAKDLELVTINATIVSPEYPLTPDKAYSVGIDPYYEEPNIQKVFIEDEDLFETKVTKTKTITTDLISQEQETYY